MENLVSCECGCTLFQSIEYCQINKYDFSIWCKDRVVKVATSFEVFKCLRCSRLTLPSVSFSGRNLLDPDVQLYKSLSEEIKTYNDSLSKDKHPLYRVELIPSFTFPIKDNYHNELRKIPSGKLEITKESSSDDNEGPELMNTPVKEESLVKAGKRNKKSS